MSVVLVNYRYEKSAVSLALLSLGFFFYAIGYFFELRSTNLRDIFLWIRVEYLGIATVPALWVTFILYYTDMAKNLRRYFWIPLFAVPVLTLVMLNTTELHRLYYRALTFTVLDGISVIHIEKGPFYYVHMVYYNLCMLAGNVLLFVNFRFANRFNRKRYLILFVVSLLPWLAMVAYLLDKSPYHPDYSAAGMAVIGVTFFYFLYKYKIFDVVPIARERVFNNITDEVIILNAQGRIIDLNDAASELFQPRLPTKISCVGKDLVEVMPGLPEDLFDPGRPVTAEYDYDNGNGKRCFEVRSAPLAGKAQDSRGQIIILRDITERKQMEYQLRLAAVTDSLTGIMNRRYFDERFVEAVHMARRYKMPLSLCICDIDDFKAVNDRYGHQTGDDAIRFFAKTIEDEIRDTDIVARYGGDEFCILFTNTDASHATIAVDRIRIRLAEDLLKVPGGGKFRIAASFGLSDKVEDDLAGEEMIRRADIALYMAKRTGKDRCEIWTPELIRSEAVNTEDKRRK